MIHQRGRWWYLKHQFHWVQKKRFWFAFLMIIDSFEKNGHIKNDISSWFTLYLPLEMKEFRSFAQCFLLNLLRFVHVHHRDPFLSSVWRWKIISWQFFKGFLFVFTLERDLNKALAVERMFSLEKTLVMVAE